MSAQYTTTKIPCGSEKEFRFEEINVIAHSNGKSGIYEALARPRRQLLKWASNESRIPRSA